MWLIDIFLGPWRWWQRRQTLKRRMAELRKRDPFIYR